MRRSKRGRFADGRDLRAVLDRKAAEGEVEFLLRKGMQKSDVAAGDVVARVRAAIGR